MRRIRALFSLLACSLIFFGSLSELFADTSKPLKIGVLIPLSGDAASMGTAFKNGMTLAYSELSPEQQKQIKLLFEDDQMVPKQTVSAYQKLKASDSPDMFVTFASACSNAVAPLMERDGVLLVAVATDPKIVENRKWAMNLWVTPEEEARVALAEMQRRGLRRMARIGSMQDGVIAAQKVFDKQNRGIVEISHDQLFPQDVKDFKTYIAQVNADTNLDGISVFLLPGQLAAFAKELRRSGSKLPISGFEMFEDINEIKAAEGALLGAWYVNSDDATSEFLKKYSAAFPGASSLTSSNGYDIVKISALAAQKGSSRAELNQFFHNLRDFKGALGKYSASGDNRFTLPAAVKVVKADGFERLSGPNID